MNRWTSGTEVKALLCIRMWSRSNVAKDSWVLFDLKWIKNLGKVNHLPLITQEWTSGTEVKALLCISIWSGTNLAVVFSKYFCLKPTQKLLKSII